MVLSLLHDTAIGRHRGKELTLSAACMNYHWPKMYVNIEYISMCVQDSVLKPVPIIKDPPPARQWGVIALNLIKN